MALPLVVLLAFCGVLCLAPFSTYLSWLSILNRRLQPTVLRGSADLIALCVGLSGFLVIGGALVVGLTNSNARFAARGNWEQILAAWGQEQTTWLLIAGVYTLLVGGFIGWLAMARQRTLVIFSVDRWVLDQTVNEILTDLGQTPIRQGQLWSTPQGGPLVEINYFQGMYHATVKWLGPDRRLGEELERELRRRLASVAEVGNVSSVWLLWAALTCMIVMLGCLLLVMYYLYLVSR